MRAFTIVELTVALVLIVTLIGTVMITTIPLRNQTDKIQFSSVIRQAKLQLISQKLNDPTQAEYTFIDEKGYRWVYTRRTNKVECYTPYDVKIHSSNIYTE